MLIPLVQPYSHRSEALLRVLLEAGVTPKSLLEEWGVILWSLKARQDEIKIKVHSLRTVNEKALQHHLQVALGSERPVSLKLKPLSKCCYSGCEGCLSGHPQKRTEWVEPVSGL